MIHQSASKPATPAAYAKPVAIAPLFEEDVGAGVAVEDLRGERVAVPAGADDEVTKELKS